jgi:hypothetical protein
VSMRVNVLRGEGLAAHNARREHCPNGHAYTAYLRRRGPQRLCLECSRLWKQNRRAAGLCRHCSAAVVPGRGQCADHLARDREIAKRKRAEKVA